MSPSRRGDSGGSRTAEQRERDRRERERRRAQRAGGGPGGTGAFDIYSEAPDPTVSRPPDLDWPLDTGTAERPAAAIEWAGPRGPAPEPARRHVVFDPDTGSQVFVSDEPPVAPEAIGDDASLAPPGTVEQRAELSGRREAGAHDAGAVEDQPGAHDQYAGHEQPTAHDERSAGDGYPAHPGAADHPGYEPHPGYEAPPGYEAHSGYEAHPSYQAQPGHEPQLGYAAHPGAAPHPGYGDGSDRHPGYGDPAGGEASAGYPGAAARPGAARPGRRSLGGRLPSVPSLPAGLGGLGDRLSGLRGARVGSGRDARPDQEAAGGGPSTRSRRVIPAGEDEPAVRRRVIPARAGGRPAPGRPATAGAGGASRASSLRRSLDPRSAFRSTLSDPISSSRSRRLPSRPRGRVGAIVALVVVVVVLWFLFSLFQPLKGSGHGQVDVVIPAGAGTSAIGALLAKDHVISSSFFFKLRVELSGKRGKLESGRYVLKQGMSYGAALAALTGTAAQPAVTIKVTIPEGFSRIQIAALAKRAGVVGDYVAASAHSHVLKPTSYGAPASVHSLEGFLFPDTYDLLPGDPVSKLINEQLVAFKQQLATVDLTAAKHVNLTPYDVIKIASMVERETSKPSERPLIAAVIYNRLKANMTLGIDATLRYALNDYDKPLTQSQLESKSPYNTRLHRGLPPTPIGNPGLASLEAAAHPAKVSYLYYVVKPGTCGDVFSTTFAQFEHDSAVYNAARAADHGRSPTTCSG
jgi:peptidoglycan lytic transglycosylase G